MRALLANQTEAFEKLRKYKVGALFMDPGTGKTYTAYRLARSVKNVDYLLWLGPYRTIHTDKKESSVPYELDKCGGMWTQYDMVGIESLSNSDRIYLELMSKLEKAKNPLIVVDESLKIKNWEAKRTRRIIELGKKARYKLILNGTPLSRNLLDLWSQMEFLSPKILGMDTTRFKNTYCEYTTIRKKFPGGYKKEITYISGFHNVEHLYSLIKHYVYECELKLDVYKNYRSYNYCLSEADREQYEDIADYYLKFEIMMLYDNKIFLSMVQKMQHSYSCTDDKFDTVDYIFKTHDPKDAIIFCKYLDSTAECAKRYPKALVLTYGKHTYGLNLQHKNLTIFFDKTYNYAQRLQAENRTYRNGQNENCLFFDLDGDCGLDKLINSNISKKEDLLEYFRRVGIKALKDDLRLKQPHKNKTTDEKIPG